jgi:hypothetical protein
MAKKKSDETDPAAVSSGSTNGDSKLLGAPAEILYAEEIETLAKEDTY